jgi:hypothetical protein
MGYKDTAKDEKFKDTWNIKATDLIPNPRVPLKESYRLCIGSWNRKASQDPTTGYTTTDNNNKNNK